MLKTYLIEYREQLSETSEFFLCEADTDDHALEQVRNAYEEPEIIRFGKVEWFTRVEVSNA